MTWINTNIITLRATGQDGRQIYWNTINDIRNAAGHGSWEDVRESQDYNGGVIGLRIFDTTNLQRGTLFINPHSLYIAGFTGQNNIYYFQDAHPSVISEIQRYAASVNRPATVVRMNGSYRDWEQQLRDAGRTLQNNFDAPDFLAAITTLGNAPGPDRIYNYHTQIADAARTLAAAYELGVRFPAYRDNVGDAMALPADGMEAVVYNLESMELRAETGYISNYYHAAQQTNENHCICTPNHLTMLIADGLGDMYIGPENGTWRFWGDLERNLRMVIGDGTSR
ncbi:MAG TPA: hypothetical protein VIS09_07365 [Streptomyces sp.]